MQIPRDPFAFPKKAAARSSWAGLCLPFRSRAPKPPSPLFYLGCAGNRPGADSARSPRVSQAQRAATASANRRSLGASRGSPEQGGARARKRPGGARRRGEPAQAAREGPRGTEAGRAPRQNARTGHARAPPRGGGRGGVPGRGNELGKSSEVWRSRRVCQASGAVLAEGCDSESQATGAICESKVLPGQNLIWLERKTAWLQMRLVASTFSVAESPRELAELWFPVSSVVWREREIGEGTSGRGERDALQVMAE